MKIRVTLEVPDAARAYISKLAAGGETTVRGRATRDAVISFLQATVARLVEDFEGVPTGRLTQAEARDASDAIEWLRLQGKTDGQIRAWLLMQRARLHFGKSSCPDSNGGSNG